MGMVFQSYAIWPHMSVAQNVAYPLKVRRVARAEIARRVSETLELIGLAGLQDRPASKLSGGQQQRVALARAIINRPRVLLLDEPLSNLDAKLRARMRFELLRLQREVGITSIFVTHDQTEAMAIADELIVMRQGGIEQRGDARSLYLRPASVFVADFIFGANFISGELVGMPDAEGNATIRLSGGGDAVLRGILAEDRAAPGGRYAAVIRPEAFKLHVRGAGGAHALEAEVLAVQYLGSCLEARVSVHGTELRVSAEPSAALASGDRISLAVAPADCILLSEQA
jgi:iron(III) transport system ATP-binding protein